MNESGIETGIKTYHHSHSRLLSIRLLLHRIVQNYIQENIVAAESARNAAGAVELDQEALVEVLWKESVSVSERTWENKSGGSGGILSDDDDDDDDADGLTCGPYLFELGLGLWHCDGW